MDILYDYQIFDSQRTGGISRYYVDLYNGIRNDSPHHASISVLYSENQYLRESTDFKVRAPFCGLDRYVGSSHPLLKARVCHYLNPLIPMRSSRDLNAAFTRQQIALLKPDLIHLTYYDDVYEGEKLPPYVLTIHDMIYESKPEFFGDLSIIEKKRKLALNASRIVVVSEFTKCEILRHYPTLVEDKIDVIYHGINEMKTLPAEARERKSIAYLLYVGGRWSYKNFYFMVSGLRSLLLQENLKLYCVGAPFSQNEICYLSFLGLTGHVVNTGFVTDEALGSLYHNALALIYPSQIEGFGIPLLEGMKYDTPLILSDIPVFREVAGDAALYFDPTDGTDLERTVRALTESQETASVLTMKGRERVQFFSKERMIENTVQCYERAGR